MRIDEKGMVGCSSTHVLTYYYSTWIANDPKILSLINNKEETVENALKKNLNL